MFEIIEKKLQAYELELKKYNELLVNCNHSSIRHSLCNKIDITENIIAELYDILNETIIQGKAPMSAFKATKQE